MKEAQEQQKNSNVPEQLRPYAYKKGQSGNPGGRPKGAVSLKEYAKQMLAKMSPEEREEFLNGIDKKTIWEMAEGKAKQETEHSGTLTIGEVLDELDGSTTNKQTMEDQSPL